MADATKVASENRFPLLRLTHIDDTPATPPTGEGHLVSGADKVLRWIDDDGVISELGQGLVDPMTTRGDIIVRNASNVTARLGRGTAGQVFTSDGTDVGWAAPTGGGGVALFEEWVDRANTTCLNGATFTNASRTSGGGPGGNDYIVGTNGSGSLYTMLSLTGMAPYSLLLFSAYVKTSSGGGTNMYANAGGGGPIFRLPNYGELPGSWTETTFATKVGSAGTLTLQGQYAAAIADMRVHVIAP